MDLFKLSIEYFQVFSLFPSTPRVSLVVVVLTHLFVCVGRGVLQDTLEKCESSLCQLEVGFFVNHRKL
mgnify:CR=1 FL=1